MLAILLLLSCSPTYADELVSPSLHVPVTVKTPPHVALTFDACGGKADDRILSVLTKNRIKATIFVTARWMRRNPKAMSSLLQHPDLFEIENHGARHVMAIDKPSRFMGVRAAGSADAIRTEITDGSAAIMAATGLEPHWYRGAAALYTTDALQLISAMSLHVAGFSLSGDGGAMYSEARATRVISQARNGDVIIAHLNQPSRPAGAGVARGVLALKEAGFIFVRLDEK